MLVVINSYQTKRLRAFTMLSSRLVPGKLARPRWVVRSTRTRPWAPPLLRQPGARAAVELRSELRSLQAVSGGVSLSFWAIKHRQAAQCLTESGPPEDGGKHAAHIEGKTQERSCPSRRYCGIIFVDGRRRLGGSRFTGRGPFGAGGSPRSVGRASAS